MGWVKRTHLVLLLSKIELYLSQSFNSTVCFLIFDYILIHKHYSNVCSMHRKNCIAIMCCRLDRRFHHIKSNGNGMGFCKRNKLRNIFCDIAKLCIVKYFSLHTHHRSSDIYHWSQSMNDSSSINYVPCGAIDVNTVI